MKDKIRRSISDKIGSVIVFFGTIAIYIIDKVSPFLEKDEYKNFAPIIPFVSALSLFCFIWSFIWENKIQKLYKKIVENENDVIRRDFIQKIQDHNKLLKSNLVKPNCIESRILKEYEMNLYNFLSFKNFDNEVALVYIFTNAADVENEEFGSVICNNILNNCYYIYITPFDNEKFKRKILDTLLKNIPKTMTEECFKAIFLKRVIHISVEKLELFSWLPGYSDFVIYTKKKIDKLDRKIDGVYGYYSFQNGADEFDDVECYFYREMTKEHSRSLIKLIESLDENEGLKSIAKNVYSESVQIRKDGMYCIKPIKKDELIMNIDGILKRKEDLDSSTKENIRYLQFDRNYTVVTQIPIFHSCKKPNCGIKEKFQIIAIEDIDIGQEILIDYAFFDPDYEKFECNYCQDGNCSRKGKSVTEIVESLHKGPNKDFVSDYLK